VEELELQTAENAFVRCKDYPGIQFVKRLQSIQQVAVRKAEVKQAGNLMKSLEKKKT